MKPDDRDISTLRHIVRHCDDIIDAINKHNLTLDIIEGKMQNICNNAS